MIQLLKIEIKKKNTIENEEAKEKVITRRKSNRDRKEPDNSSESINWQGAMTNEFKCITKNETYELIEMSKIKKIINVKWFVLRIVKISLKRD